MHSPNNLIAGYFEQAAELEQVVSAISAEIISLRPDETRWSVLEISGHLADAELLASVRIRRIITQDRANLWGYKQELWASGLNYGQRNIESALTRFALLRRENAALLADLPEGVWNQTGVHDEYGTLSLRQLISDYVDHTAKHLDQIRKVAAEFASSPESYNPMKGIRMAKTQEKQPQAKEEKAAKNKKDKDMDALVGRVKKVVKKSRRKLNDEKFEKQLQRTITFLEELQHRIIEAENGSAEKASKSEKKLAAKAKGKKGGKNARTKSKTEAAPSPTVIADVAPGEPSEVSATQPESAVSGD